MQVDRLNPSSMLDRAKRKLGIKTFILPFTDDELMQVLYEDTLPVFSIYFPRYLRHMVNLNTLKNAENVNGLKRRYFLNMTELKDVQIIDIEDVTTVQSFLDEFNWNNQNMGGLDAYSMTANLYNDAVIESMMSTPITFKFEPPNILNFENSACILNGDVEIKFLVCHAQDLSTVQYAQREMLFELFKLDLQISLYAELKHYDQINTTFGQIELKIDDWADAESKRFDIIQKWKETFLSFREKTIFKM